MIKVLLWLENVKVPLEMKKEEHGEHFDRFNVGSRFHCDGQAPRADPRNLQAGE